MIENGKKTHFATTVYGWIVDIQNRFIGLEGMTGLYEAHVEFITYIMDEVDSSTFEEYKERCTLLMNRHAIARNDIYDNVERLIYLDENGLVMAGSEYAWVSRKEYDLRYLLEAWTTEEE